MQLAASKEEPLVIGRYALFGPIASGGMATVHLGRQLGDGGSGRTVAVKRLHEHYSRDPDFVTMFMDEARIVARIQHPNVVPMVEAIQSSHGLFLVMEYIHGESFSRLLRTCREARMAVPLRILSAIMHGVLLGLNAAHDTKGPNGELLAVVHRDVSPQNVIVGADGIARVLDFGVAKAIGRAQVTREGELKGKLTYMAPEQIRGGVDRRADVFAAGIMLWEAITGRRFHEGASDVEIVTRLMEGSFSRPSAYRADVGPDLDAIVMRALDVDRHRRYQSARDMALDLERVVGIAGASEVADWVARLARDSLGWRANRVAEVEKASAALNRVPSQSPARLTSLPPTAGEPATVSATKGVSAAREPPPPAPRSSRTALVAVMSFLLALALAGLVLGGVAIYARQTSQPQDDPPVGDASSERAAPTVGSAKGGPSSSVPHAPPTGLSSAAASSASGATSAVPRVRPPRPPPGASSASSKKNCPPVVIDENGHRKYQLGCME